VYSTPAQSPFKSAAAAAAAALTMAQMAQVSAAGGGGGGAAGGAVDLGEPMWVQLPQGPGAAYAHPHAHPHAHAFPPGSPGSAGGPFAQHRGPFYPPNAPHGHHSYHGHSPSSGVTTAASTPYPHSPSELPSFAALRERDPVAPQYGPWVDPDDVFVAECRKAVTQRDKTVFWEMCRAVMELPKLADHCDTPLRRCRP